MELDIRDFGFDDVFFILFDLLRIFVDFGEIEFILFEKIVEVVVDYYCIYGVYGGYIYLKFDEKK